MIGELIHDQVAMNLRYNYTLENEITSSYEGRKVPSPVIIELMRQPPVQSSHDEVAYSK